jgi:hypothetical protein
MEEQYGELELEILAASAELLQTDALQLQVDAMLSGKRAPALSLWQKDALLVAADALLVAAEKKKKENKGEKKKMNQIIHQSNFPLLFVLMHLLLFLLLDLDCSERHCFVIAKADVIQ